MSRADREKRRQQPQGGGTAVSAPPAEVAVAAVGDIDSLRRELAAERQNRAWLESRLEELDKRLQRAVAGERAALDAAAQDQVAVLGLQTALTADRTREADREALEMWIIEAQIRADAATPEPLAPVRVETIQTIREPVIIRETVTVREAVVDGRFEEKLTAAKMAIEAAEARAANQAAQVRKLTEELAAARAEQTRTLNNLHALEQRLHGLEARADLLDTIVSEKSAPVGEPEFGLPADALSPLTPEKPKLVFTETESGTQLAPLEEESPSGLHTAPAVEEFEPKPFAPQAEAPQAAPPAQENLVDAFTELFGAEEDDASVVAPAAVDHAAATPRADELDSIADALEAWGSGPAVPMEVPGLSEKVAAQEAATARRSENLDSLADAFELWGSEPGAADATPETPAAPAAANAGDDASHAPANDDPFADLASALESLSTAPIERGEQSEGSLEAAFRDDRLDALAASLEPMSAAPIPALEAAAEAGAEAEDEIAALAAERVEEMAAPVETTSPVEAAHESLQEEPAPQGGVVEINEAPRSLYAAMHQAEEERHSAQKQRPAHLVEAAKAARENKGDDKKKNKKSEPKGREAMMDALLRFMGPQ